MNKKTLKRAAAIALAATAVAVAADTVTLHRDIDLRSQKSTMFPVVATARAGQTLTVLQSGDVWLQVQQGDTIGWVRKVDLEKPSGIAAALGSADASANGTAAAGSMSEGNAIRGLEPGTDAYAKATGNDPSQLNKLIALRKKLINDGTLVKFDKQGKVGLGK